MDEVAVMFHHMMRRVLSAICLMLIFGGPAKIAAQDSSKQQEAIRIETNLVSVPVIVSDQQGRYVAGLKREDFTIYQDRIRQQIAFFATSEEPLNVALLLDTSQSTRQILGEIKKTAAKFLKQLRPQDKAMVVTFDYDVHILCPLTSDQKIVEKAVKKAEIGDYVGTTLRDAIIRVTTGHLRGITGRKAIILLTDGKDHRSQTTMRELLGSIEESDTMIYPIYYTTGPAAGRMRPGRMPMPFPRRGPFGRRFPMPQPQRFPRPQRPEINQRANEKAEEFLQSLADNSAGRFYRSDAGDLKKTFELITDELRYQYRIGFYPESAQPGESHQLKVEVARPGLVVRARRTYRMPFANAQ